ncbi:MAG: LysR family transcriptional regulator [Myxococcales bacterium]|nr:LysR family transcriptional regulator [Myxococcales bacterium]
MKLDWNDLRYLLAIAGSDSTRAAAEQLGVSHPTVSRRLDGMQQALGARLLERIEGSWQVTPAGEEALAVAREVQTRIDELEASIRDRDLHVRGTVRITVPEALVGLLAASFDQFAATFPKLQVELIVDDALLSVTRREADIALRITDSPPEHLIGKRLAHVALAAYAAPTYLEHAPRDLDDPGAHRWIGWDERFGEMPVARWMRAHVRPSQVAFRINSTGVLRHAIAAGIGVGILGTFLGEGDPGLRRLGEPITALDTDLWLLTHPDYRKSPPVRACMEHLQKAMQATPNPFQRPA